MITRLAAFGVILEALAWSSRAAVFLFYSIMMLVFVLLPCVALYLWYECRSKEQAAGEEVDEAMTPIAPAIMGSHDGKRCCLYLDYCSSKPVKGWRCSSCHHWVGNACKGNQA